MKTILIIFLILIHEITSINKLKQEFDSMRIRKGIDDDRYYSERIKRTINKLSLTRKNMIDKEELRRAFTKTIEQTLLDFNFQLFRKDEKNNYMYNLFDQIFYKLVENEKDDIKLEDAYKLYDANKILKATEEVMKEIGHRDMIERITNDVINLDEDDDDNKGKRKIPKHRKKRKDDISADL